MRFSLLQMIIISVCVFFAATGILSMFLQKADHPGEFKEQVVFSEGEIFEATTTSRGLLSREGLSNAQELPATPVPSQSEGPMGPPLDVNRASRDDFLRVRGLSPQLADAIILFREEGGNFKNIEDLQKIPGISAKKFAEISPFLIIDGAGAKRGPDAVDDNDAMTTSTEGMASEDTHSTADVIKPISSEVAQGKPNLININTASISELVELPGIGIKTAERIVDYREKKGPFRKIDTITRVKGIGPKLFEKIRNRITVGD